MRGGHGLGLTILAILLLATAAFLWSQNAIRLEEMYTEAPNQPFAEFFADDPPSLVPLSRYTRAAKGRDPFIPLMGPPMLLGSTVRSGWREVEVIGVEWNGERRAYLLGVVVWHRVVLDLVGEQPLAITYDPTCDSIAVFDMQDRKDQRFFGVSGLVLDSNMVLYDRGEMSLWPQILGECTTGKKEREELRLVPFVRTTWGDWVETHPDTLVQYVGTGRVESAAYMRAWPRLPEFPVEKVDPRLAAKEPIIGVRDGRGAKAYLVSVLKATGLLNDTVGKRPVILLTKSQTGATRVYERGSHVFALSGQQLQDERGRLWRWSEGELIQPETGEHLPRVPIQTALWFAWANAFPKTEVYGSG